VYCSPARCPVTPATTKCPEPLRALKVLPLAPWLLSPRRPGVTPPSMLLQAHAPILNPPTAYGHRLGQRVCAGCGQPLLGKGPSQRYFHKSFPRCLDPYPGAPRSALTRFFPQGIGLPHFLTGSARHKIPDNDFNPGIDFGATAILSCSGLRVCSPPRSFPPQRSLPVRHRVAAVGFGG